MQINIKTGKMVLTKIILFCIFLVTKTRLQKPRLIAGIFLFKNNLLKKNACATLTINQEFLNFNYKKIPLSGAKLQAS